MLWVLLQAAQPGDGLRVDPAWVIAVATGLLSTLTGTIAVLYRGQIAALRERIDWLEAEGVKKDAEKEKANDRLIRALEMAGRAAGAAEATVSLVEKRLT